MDASQIGGEEGTRSQVSSNWVGNNTRFTESVFPHFCLILCLTACQIGNISCHLRRCPHLWILQLYHQHLRPSDPSPASIIASAHQHRQLPLIYPQRHHPLQVLAFHLSRRLPSFQSFHPHSLTFAASLRSRPRFVQRMTR